ncbi:TetR/AcrR family transcriptional regulator [Aeromicrobium terrae]|uniref:TetR/AcrR family transcriptional regulator n=1 Tax=Aeromicrobium terrae TaxID=2498846 RepID=A0A5C8NJY0_9ACTN|nr:TetR/AcrR family transcriptional regulator [Aeromicrobium terrae]TXL61165.1 TetR/AcrR family transcriptional regulator [Aeromicrobium terrae]
MSSPDGLRSDARRNRHQVLDAARRVVLQHGPTVALDEIAKEAGVGIGTLYRRFGDRDGLFKALVLDALAQAQEAAEKADADHEVGFDAIEAYALAALDLRTSALIPMLMDRLDLHDAELGPQRETGAAVLQGLIDRAHEDGSLPRTVTFADLGTLLVRLSRPLPGAVPAEADADLARRQLRLALLGMRHADESTLDRVGMSREELSSD